MRLFITHAGYNSILETVISGVPMLAIPLFFDQHRNARVVEYRGMARILQPHTISVRSMKRELGILLSDERLVVLLFDKIGSNNILKIRQLDFLITIYLFFKLYGMSLLP